MSQVFHDIEKQIIIQLSSLKKATPQKLEQLTSLSPDQIRRGVEWLRLKNLVHVKQTTKTTVSLGSNGIQAHKNNLPERQLLNLLQKNSPQKISALQQQMPSQSFGPAMGLAKKNGWIQSSGDTISLVRYPDSLPEEQIISLIGNSSTDGNNNNNNNTNGIPLDQITDIPTYHALKKRPDFIIENTIKSNTISFTDSSKRINFDKLLSSSNNNNNTSTTTTSTAPIDVEAAVPLTFLARRHPLKETIDEIREIFVTLGFTEIVGSLSQSSFWNFDALFTPQDHPAREMQDTFFLDKINARKFASAQQINKVSTSHKKNWRYLWDIQTSKKMVLRTHTTCITIKHLAEHKPDEARLFSLGSVFRNEKPSYKHLVEFNQVEGVVIGSDTTLRDLMGIQKEFYKQIGITKIKFWPTFFPYTEPSLQTMVYNEKLGKWVELFGMGIFRPEVTKPLGITKPVLAWGGGIERIAMLKYGLNDVRQFFSNDIDWLRKRSVS